MPEAEHGDDAGEGVTPAQMARNFAAGLARLTALARDPRAARSLLTFADVLETMAQDAAQLAVFLGEEEADGLDQDDADEHAAPEPGGDASSAPLSFDSLNHAVELLTRDTKTRLWPDEREARELAPLIVEAVATVQATTKALYRFLMSQAEARALLMQGHRSDREPDTLKAVGHAVVGSLDFLDAFEDMKAKGADAALSHLLRSLNDVRRGRASPLFEPVQGLNRSSSTTGTLLRGLAACAMDARHRAGETLPLAASAVATLFVGVMTTRSNSGKDTRITADTLVQWRKDARAGKLTPSEAQDYWNTYAREAEALAKREHRHHPAPDWRAAAKKLEARIADLLSGEPPGFTLSGSAQDDARDKRHGVGGPKAPPRKKQARE